MSQISQDCWEQWLLHWWQPQTKQNQIGIWDPGWSFIWIFWMQQAELDFAEAVWIYCPARGWAPSSPWDNGLVFSGEEQAAPSLGTWALPAFLPASQWPGKAAAFCAHWTSLFLPCVLFQGLWVLPSAWRDAGTKKSVPFFGCWLSLVILWHKQIHQTCSVVL